MSWHAEALPPKASRLFGALAKVPDLERFYLAGGTGLALQRGHRLSVDLDFFSAADPLDESRRRNLKGTLSRLGEFSVREEKEGTLHSLIQGVETSFLSYRYPLVRPARRWRGLRVASLADIGLMKIGAIIGRGSRKDFRDLREITRGLPLEDLLRLAPKKFPDAEDFLFQASKALVYFDDAEAQPDVRLLRPEPWAEVKTYFQREVPRVFRSLYKLG